MSEERKTSGQKPPQWLDNLLVRLVTPDLVEEMLGDLHERYHLRVQKVGGKRANKIYLRESIAYLRASFFKRRNSNRKPFYSDMIQNHFRVALRNIMRGKAFSAINITGLAFGITCFLLIFLWIREERAINNFHENGDRLYTVYYSENKGDNITGGYQIPHVHVSEDYDYQRELAQELLEVVPEIEYAISYGTSYELPWGSPRTFRVGDRLHKMKGSAAGEDFFKMFSYPLITGDKVTALQGRQNIAISRRMAEVFFESPEKAMGQNLHYENKLNFTVTAVFEDITPRSTLQFDYLVNWELVKDFTIDRSANYWNTFIQLKENTDPHTVDLKIRGHLTERLSHREELTVTLGIQPFRDQYLVSNFQEGVPDGGRIEYIRIFTWVAIFILLVACINFMNLATARSVKRAKEVGVRKVIGSSKSYLVSQFLIESVIMSFFAMLLSLVIVVMLGPAFNELTGRTLRLPWDQPLFWLALSVLTITIGVISGSYPAFFLSSLKPSVVLKGVTRFKGKAVWLQKSLVVFQFSLSILMLISTIVVSWQTGYIQNVHLGYDKENLISVRIEGELSKENPYLILKEELQKMPGIAMVDRSSEAPHSMAFEMSNPFKWQGQENASVGFLPTSVGYDFLKLMKLQLVEGRDFDRRIASDSVAFMVNETALRQMGLEEPLGKWISAWKKRGHIIGILKDYHTHSLHDPIKPLIVDVKEDLDFGLVLVRTEPGKTKQALASMEEVFNRVNPDYPLDYQFLDQEYASLYRSEQVISGLSNAFAAQAIIISCLGLLGLAMFSAEQRVKEIGIRKVLGASISSIIGLFSKEFLRLVGVSFIIATPVAWWLMNDWLEGFAYRIDLAWWIFAGTGGLTLFIALTTISLQAIKAALANPVNSLRAE